ncbi:hypothetical protein QOZ80_5AG0367710 [Eleusine coracana subsp. coracana]|nr:hypothetical protein QOZ80_5AG0367710 [Eleusine coracana subsp. coracana]
MPEAPPPPAGATAALPESHREALEYIERVTSSAGEVQRRVLAEILSQNAPAEYLRLLGVSGAAPTAVDDFRRAAPLVTYEDILPDVLRIANGDTSPILSGKPIREFLTSSGTSGGERKLMPTIADEMDRRSLLYSLLMPVMSRAVPGLDKGKAMYLYFVKAESRTPGGLPARPVLTSFYRSRHFLERPHDPYTVYTSPDEAVLCVDAYQSMYAQLLCGLVHRADVLRVGAVFASGFLRAIRFLEKHWPRLCRDIRTGELDAEITDRAVRGAVERVLVRPDPDLADAIEAECGKASWQGIIRRVWPRTKYIDVIVTGAMAQYIPTLEFYGGGLPLTCTMYASSECYFGLNLNPMCSPSDVAYTLIPTMCYFEFLPVHQSSSGGNAIEPDHRDLVDLVDVKLGHEYELVVTTYSGLYRYRVGDVLRVAGFKNQAPQFNFVRRKNVALSIDSDKTDEGAARGGERRRDAPGALRRVARRVHLLRRRDHHPGPLRALLGAPGRGEDDARAGLRVRGLLPCRRGGAQQRVPPGPGRRPVNRPSRDPGRLRRHVRQAHGLRARARRVHQPVQGAKVRAPGTRRRPARREGAGDLLQPQVPQVDPRKPALERQQWRSLA